MQNCLSFLAVAEKYDLKKAVDECNKFLLENFDTISHSKEFTKLSKEKLCGYLSDDKLKVRNGEIEVFRATLKWYKTNQSVERTGLIDLMQHVRFPLIPGDLLLDEVLTSRLVSENPQVMKIVTEALRFHNDDNIFLKPLQEGKQFQPRGEEMLALVHSRLKNTLPVEVAETKLYMFRGTVNRPFNTQFSEQDLPVALYPLSLSLVTTGNYLFLFGAEADCLREIAVRFDVRTNTWLDLKCPPHDASMGMGTALLKGHIYLLGGMQVTRDNLKSWRFSSVEGRKISACASKYTIETNSWTKVEKLPKPLVFHSAASHGNCVFCAGGQFVADLGNLYAFDVVGQIWLSKAPMNCPRSFFSLETVGAKLVACGGDVIDTESVEIYDIADNQWTLIHNDVIGNNMSLATIVKDSEVYVIGGQDGNFDDTDDVYIVDVDKATIRRVSNIPFPASDHACVLLTVPNAAASAQKSRVNNN